VKKGWAEAKLLGFRSTCTRCIEFTDSLRRERFDAITGSGFTFGGLRSRSNNLSIDGLDNNDEYTGSSRTELSPEIVQEFQVVNNGLSAESGGASGGSINVITRSGTNMVHGDAFLFVQDGALNAREPFERSPASIVSTLRAGLALGGPVHKGQNVLLRRSRTRTQPGANRLGH